MIVVYLLGKMLTRLVDIISLELGKTDVEGQIANCRQYGELIGQRLTEAREASAAKGRLYMTLGFAGGMALALLLL